MSQLGAAGLEPATSGLKGRCSESITPDEQAVCDGSQNTLGVLLAVLQREAPELATVVTAWSTLPEPIRAAILTMVGVGRS
jgi:hypothetical protein